MGLQKGIPFPSSLQGSRNLLRNQHLPISAPLTPFEWGNLISPARTLHDLVPCLCYYTLSPRETRRHQINKRRRVDPHSFNLLIGAYSNPNSYFSGNIPALGEARRGFVWLITPFQRYITRSGETGRKVQGRTARGKPVCGTRLAVPDRVYGQTEVLYVELRDRLG